MELKRLVLVQVTAAHLGLGLWVIVARELSKFFRQRERLLSSLVRPLLWLLVFATGMHDLLGVSIIPPYRTYTPYQEYVLPGLVGVVVLFQSMQSALSLVYDREAGVMRVMLVTPLPRAWLLFSKDRRRGDAGAGSGGCVPRGRRPSQHPHALGDGLVRDPGGVADRADAGRDRPGGDRLHPADREFCRDDELCDLPDVLPVLRPDPLWKLRESGAEIVWYLAMANPFTPRDRIGVSIGTVVHDVLHYVLDASYAMNYDARATEEDDVFMGSLSLIWDISERFSAMGEGRIMDFQDTSDQPFLIGGGMTYGWSENLSSTFFIPELAGPHHPSLRRFV